MIRPKKLPKGGTVALLAASSPLPEEGLGPAVAVAERMGLRVVAGESCRARRGYLAGSDEARAAELNNMFADKGVDGIFCVRGGYGSQRILDKLDYNMIKNNVKAFCGFSDVTALHAALNQLCGFVTYHSPMVSGGFYKDAGGYSERSFAANVLESGGRPLFINKPGEELICLVPGACEGELCGGNLSVLAASLGTPYEIDARNKILFLEEVDEAPYRVDRMLTQLRLAGKFRDCAGIILGSFTKCEAKEPEKSLSLAQIFEDIIAAENKPAVMNFTCGHALPSLTLPLGERFRLDSAKGEIQIRG